MSCDIVAVGTGPAGLSASIQAAELGLATIAIEANSFAGGNLAGTACVMGLQTPQAIAQGIDITPQDVVTSELQHFMYRVDALKWVNLCDASADDVQWLKDHGVQFRDEVVDYAGLPVERRVAHCFAQGSDWNGAMVKAAEDAGAQILLETRGRRLVMDGGKVAGILAERADGSWLQIDAPAIVIATGGYVNNDELVRKAIHMDEHFTRSVGGHQGDGRAMAVEVGAKDMFPEHTLMGYPAPRGMLENMGWYYAMKVNWCCTELWVNQNGERFTNEACTNVTPGLQIASNLTQKSSYTLFDHATFEAFKGGTCCDPDSIVDIKEMTAAAGHEVADMDEGVE